MKKLDLNYLESITEGDKDLILELIDIFKSQIPEYREDFKQAFENKDALRLSKIAHKAKSSVAIMGLTELTQVLRKLEFEAQEGTFSDHFASYIKQFEMDCADAVIQLDEDFS